MKEQLFFDFYFNLKAENKYFEFNTMNQINSRYLKEKEEEDGQIYFDN